MSMEDTLKDAEKQAMTRASKLNDIEGEVKKWLGLLVDNMHDDPQNAQTYVQNATLEVNEYIAEASLLNVAFEELIIPMKSSRKLKRDAMAQNIMPLMIVAKILKLISER